MGLMTTREFDKLRAFVSNRYAQSGQPPDVVAALDQHNDRVLRHVDEIAAGEGIDAGEHELLRTIAVLHDVAKADTHLMLHADVGSDIAGAQLRELGKDDAFIAEVQRAIRCHMGPFPFIDEEAEKYAERTGDHLHFPRPESAVEKLFYDADMLALIDIEGIEKVVVLRETTPEFIAEDQRTSAEEGITARAAAYRSALQSVQRAADTLFSDTARTLAAGLVADAQRHVTQRLTAEDATAS
jgi:hypothetical protein